MILNQRKGTSFFSTLSSAFGTHNYKSNEQADPLYYKYKLRTIEASKLLKNRKFTSSYIVVLDSGVQQDYYNKFYGKFIADAIFVPEWGFYHQNAWTSYRLGNNHGTEVQFTIDEVLYQTGINNFVPNVRTIQYKILEADGSGTIDRLIFAINDIVNNYAKQKHMNIAAINYSSGITWQQGTAASIKEYDKNRLQSAIDNAVKNGIAFVTCSGNANKEIYEYPALSNNVIVVGGTNSKDNRYNQTVNGDAFGSCFGSQVDITAPAQEVLVYEDDWNGQIVKSGTSYSAPMVAAAVGILKSVSPNLKVNQIADILKSTATSLSSKGKDNYFGHGLLNIDKAVRSII